MNEIMTKITDESDRFRTLRNFCSTNTKYGDILAICFGGKPYIDYLMKPLSERQKDIIINYYGLFNSTPMTFREIAKERGYSRQLANKEQKKSIRIMRDRALLDNKKNGGM